MCACVLPSPVGLCQADRLLAGETCLRRKRLGQLRVFFAGICTLWRQLDLGTGWRAGAPDAPDWIFRRFFDLPTLGLPAATSSGDAGSLPAVGTMYGDWRISDTAGLVAMAVPVAAT